MKKIALILLVAVFSILHGVQVCEKQLIPLQNSCSELKKAAKTHEYTQCLQTLCTKEESCYGAQDPKTANWYFATAVALHTAKEHKKAIEYYKKALDARIGKLGSDHADVAAVHNGLGWAYASVGELAMSKENFLKALEIRKAKLGENASETKTSYSNVEWISKATGKQEAPKELEVPKQKDYMKILATLNQELEAKEKTIGSSNLQTAAVHVKIAALYEEKGEFQRSILHYNKALAIRRSKLGENHHDTVVIYSAMGWTYCSAGSYNKALIYFDKALGFYEANRGTNHPDTAAIYNNIGWTYSAMKSYDKAVEYLNKAMVIYKARLEPNNPLLIGVYHNLAKVYDAMGYYDKAKEYKELEEQTQTKSSKQ